MIKETTIKKSKQNREEKTYVRFKIKYKCSSTLRKLSFRFKVLVAAIGRRTKIVGNQNNVLSNVSSPPSPQSSFVLSPFYTPLEKEKKKREREGKRKGQRKENQSPLDLVHIVEPN